jgi:hypothetical protein
MRAYEVAGAEEMMIQYFTVDQVGGVEIIAKHILPNLVS